MTRYRLDSLMSESASTQDEPMKFDNEKVRVELVPPELVWGAARGLTYGAKKYSAGNWATGEGFEWSRLLGALERHILSWKGGEDIDAESGKHHLDLAACELSFLMAHVARGKGKDDRKEVGVAP